MVTISLKQLIDSASNDYIYQNIISIPAVEQTISRQIKTEYAKNKLARLYVNISDRILTENLNRIFGDFLSGSTSNSKSTSPSLINSNIQNVTDLKLLIDNINNLLRFNKGTADTTTELPPTSAVSQLNLNFQNFTIILEDNALLNLTPSQNELLGITSPKADTIYPKSAVMMTDKVYSSRYKNIKFPTYTGVDMVPIFMTPSIISNNITLKVISYSGHSGLIPVSTLGNKRVTGFAEGSSNIAGSLIATVTVNDPLFDMQPINYGIDNYAKSTSDVWRVYLTPDQLPRFDVVLLFSNEYGFTSALSIFGVKITDFGSVISMSDSEIEVTYTYVAHDIDLLRSLTPDIIDGGIDSFNIQNNTEFMARRDMAYNGRSEHRSHFEVASVFSKIDSRSRDLGYTRLRASGLNIKEIYNFRNNK